MRGGDVRRAAALVLAVAAAGGGPAAAQVLDRIVAVVGSRAILASELEEQFVQAQAQAQARGAPFPTDSAERLAVRRDMLMQMVEEELLVQEAMRDTTVRVTEQEVQDQVEQTVQNVRRNFASELDFQRQLRVAQFGSVEEWRRWLADVQRRQIYGQRLIEVRRQTGKLKPIPPTDAQMLEFWEANRGGTEDRPEVVSFRQIVIAPQPDSAARARALARADSLRALVTTGGADFAAVAMAASDDSGTRAGGGELGWFRRGVMVKEFEQAAFTLRPGDVSQVVETDFGFHVIKVERAQPAEVFARHILVIPEVSAGQLAAGRALADAVLAALRAGASFDSLARRYADPSEAKLAEDAPLAQLPPEYQAVIAADSTLGLRPVFIIGEGSLRPRFVVLDLTGHDAAGPLRFEDVRDRIRSILGEQLAREHLLNQLRRQAYVDIRL
jgi:peptidyl-prolyl cis-trans isomerase SurA